MRSGGVILLLAALLVMQAARAGEQGSYANLASILMKVGHYPSAYQRQQLRTVMAADDSRAVHVIAMAINNMQHKTIAKEDREQLETLLKTGETPEQAKNLVEVMLKMNHKLSYDNKKALKSIINGRNDLP